MSQYTGPTTASNEDSIEISLRKITALLSGAASGSAPLTSASRIPAWDSRTFTYFGSTNNVKTVTYKMGSVTKAVVTYTYVGSGASDDDDVATETVVLY